MVSLWKGGVLVYHFFVRPFFQLRNERLTNFFLKEATMKDFIVSVPAHPVYTFLSPSAKSAIHWLGVHWTALEAFYQAVVSIFGHHICVPCVHFIHSTVCTCSVQSLQESYCWNSLVVPISIRNLTHCSSLMHVLWYWSFFKVLWDTQKPSLLILASHVMHRLMYFGCVSSIVNVLRVSETTKSTR